MIADSWYVRWMAGGLGLWLGLAAAMPLDAKPAEVVSAPPQPSTKKAPQPVPGAGLFEPGPLRRIQIQIVGAALQQLRRDDRRYARATFREGTNVIPDVGIHVKGAAGSRRGLDDRPALTVNFDKFMPDQRWQGLGKIHLNNSVQDGSLMTENLCGELFRQAGVPAPRANNVRVELNGRDLGVYVMIEGFDKVFVKQYFPNAKGNVYDAGFLRDVDTDLEKLFGNKAKDQPEIKALAAAANEPDLAKRWERLQQVLDVDRFISFCAMEIICWDWDGYPLNRNNYKLYWDPDSNKITFFPHGMDQMFWEPNGPVLPNFNGLVARALVQTPEGRRRYRERMSELFTNVFKVDIITERLNQYAAHIRISIAERDPGGARNYDGQAQRIRDLIAQRAASLGRQFNVPPPKMLQFQDGVAKLSGWRMENEPGIARLERGGGPDGRSTLRIATGAPAVASWRTRLLVPGGRYRFEAMARTAGVVALKDEAGEGAGLRISGARETRPNKLAGDAPWQKLAYEFEVAPPADEVVLVCELRASQGQVWFDADSLRLVKLK